MTFIFMSILIIIVGSFIGIGALILVGRILNKIHQKVKSDLLMVLLTPVILLLVFGPILFGVVSILNEIF